MSRSVPEWVGKTDDTPVPPRVKLRVLDSWSGRCARCLSTIVDGERWHCDHILALINGGENREHNLCPLHLHCHGDKTADDLRIKSRIARIRMKRLGLRKAKGRPMPGTKASGIRKKMDGRVEKR